MRATTAVTMPALLALCWACNQPPSGPGIELSPEVPTTLDSLVVTVVDPSVDPNGKDTVTYRYVWTKDGSREDSVADLDTVSAGATKKAQTWEVSVTAFDGKAISTAGTAQVTIANTPPTAQVVVEPDNPRTNDKIYARGTAQDVDLDLSTIRYQWSVNGSVSSITSDSLAASRTTKGELWEVSVIPHDGEVEGEPGTVEFLIGNTPPEVAAASVQPQRPTKLDELSCRAEGWSDEDDDEPGYTVRWLVNGSVEAETETLSGASLVRGDQVSCELTPHDGDDAGEPVMSGTVLVANTPPSLAEVDITPNDPRRGDDVTIVLGTATDIDGDEVTFHYDWRVNGKAAGETEILPSSRFVRDDRIKVIVTPDDGYDLGEPVESREVIGANNIPEITSLVLAPADPYTDDTIDAEVITDDFDGDDIDIIYEWYVDKKRVTHSGPALDGLTWFKKHQEIYLTATPDDGADEGASWTSSTLTVNNSLPSEPEVEILPEEPDEDDDIVCTVLKDSVDADSDTVTYTFRWNNDGVAFGGAATTKYKNDTILARDRTEDDSWECEVTPNDGEEDGPVGNAILGGSKGPWTFTNCSQAGHTGPSKAQCDTAYKGTSLEGIVTVTGGKQFWTVPRTATYRIEAWGGQGKSAQSGRSGGKGARIRGDVKLKGGDKLEIIVGQLGKDNGCSGGGGGGTWVLDPLGKALVIAGGGGGTRTSVSQDGCAGRTTQYGGTGSAAGSTWGCGAKSSGLGGGGIVSSSSWGSAGAGLSSNGAWEYAATNAGKAPKNGAAGGGGGSYNAYGGFGGAGAGNGSCGGGGGGGYSGGDGGRLAGGGGSYNAGTSKSETAGVQSNHGKIVIERL